MGRGEIRIPARMDTSDVKKGSRDVIREIDRVNQHAARSSQQAAASSGKAISGVLRLIETGKVSVKSVDKIGKSVGNVVSGLSGFVGVGAALGLAGIPAASQLVVDGIDGIRASLKSVATEANEAAAAQRDYTVAALAASGSADGVAIANEAAAAATKALADARKSGTATAQEIVDLERAERSAATDAVVAQNTHADAVEKARTTQAKYADQMAQVIEKSKSLAPELAAANGGFINQHVYALAASKALRDHAASAEGLTQDQRAAERALADYIDRTGKVPPDIKTAIETPGMNPALDHFNALQSKADALDGRRIRITTIQDTILETHRQGAGNYPPGKGPAVGARVAGRFDAKDDVPVHVSRGEVILNPLQQKLVNGGMSIDRALAATGALTIRAGGAFAGGGKAADRLQRRLDRDKDRFSYTTSRDDLALARAEATPGFDDDAVVLKAERRHIQERIAQIGRTRRIKRLTRQQRQDLNEEEAGLRRQIADIAEQLKGPSPDDPGQDPFALERAQNEGFAAGLGRAAGYVFGGSGDIGTGGASALGAAGSIPALHVESLTFTNSPQNQAQVAQAGNRGNDIVSGGRVRSSRVRVAF